LSFFNGELQVKSKYDKHELLYYLEKCVQETETWNHVETIIKQLENSKMQRKKK